MKDVLQKEPWVLPHEVYGFITSIYYFVIGTAQIALVLNWASSDSMYRLSLQNPIIAFIYYAFAHFLLLWLAHKASKVTILLFYHYLKEEEIEAIHDHWIEHNLGVMYRLLPLLFHVGFLGIIRHLFAFTIRLVIPKYNYGYKIRIAQSLLFYFHTYDLVKGKKGDRDFEEWKKLYW